MAISPQTEKRNESIQRQKQLGFDVLSDPEVRGAIGMHAFCASDLVGAWGGQRLLEERGLTIDLFSGPCTDNAVGVEYLERELSVPAITPVTGSIDRPAGRPSAL